MFHPTLTTVIVPFVLLSIANFKIYKRLVARRLRTVSAGSRSLEVSQTRTLLIAVILFLLMNSPRLVLLGMEINRIKTFVWCMNRGSTHSVGTYIKMFYIYGRFCNTVNSSLNFVVYCAGGSEFQNTFFDVFRMKRNTPTTNVEGSNSSLALTRLDTQMERKPSEEVQMNSVVQTTQL
ncbi:FMRFamide receptor [Eurytemora carolleeae]|uniref:FMRFamide receptor n=1 Tax=Eurytemora carolleeae TaxID=1294199 RepID=UPI000C78AD09|nr:FMRFamide receptor [Eurytemora carolleeae]|eukprot:XP_023337158.1 FMRFamide receptor-like [Eurytemora affinis]